MISIRTCLIHSLLAVAAAAAVIAPAHADETPTPNTLAGGKVITPEEAIKLIDAKATLFVDTRSVINYGKGHLPGAISAAYKEKSEKVAAFDAKLDSFELDKLPKDKNAPVVFYSDGPTGWKSYKAAVLSIAAGHKNVMYMRVGTAGWAEKNLAFQQ